MLGFISFYVCYNRKRAKIPNLIPTEVIAAKMLILRGKRVMLDSDLAVLYEVKTKRLRDGSERRLKLSPGGHFLLGFRTVPK